MGQMAMGGKAPGGRWLRVPLLSRVGRATKSRFNGLTLGSTVSWGRGASPQPRGLVELYSLEQRHLQPLLLFLIARLCFRCHGHK